MPVFIYKGLSAEHRALMLQSYMDSIRPQDPRGRKPLYHIDQKDSEALKEKKRARIAKWKEDRKAEYEKKLDKLDASHTIKDSRGDEYVFEKGVALEVPATSTAVAAIGRKMSNPLDPYPQWAKAEAVEKKAEDKKKKDITKKE